VKIIFFEQSSVAWMKNLLSVSSLAFIGKPFEDVLWVGNFLDYMSYVLYWNAMNLLKIVGPFQDFFKNHHNPITTLIIIQLTK